LLDKIPAVENRCLRGGGCRAAYPVGTDGPSGIGGGGVPRHLGLGAGNDGHGDGEDDQCFREYVASGEEWGVHILKFNFLNN
jgi:hypothetical protein